VLHALGRHTESLVQPRNQGFRRSEIIAAQATG
jgi:hypothetical protein